MSQETTSLILEEKIFCWGGVSTNCLNFPLEKQQNKALGEEFRSRRKGLLQSPT